MKTILRFYIEVLIASILCATLGLISLLRIDFIRPGGVIFVYLAPLFPLVVMALRYGLRGSIPCALLGAILLYVSKGGSLLPTAALIEIFASFGLAGLIGLLKTYSKTSIKRVLATGLIAEGLRLIGLSLGGAFYSGAFEMAQFSKALTANFYFLAVDLAIMMALLSLGYYLTKGRLYEYRL